MQDSFLALRTITEMDTSDTPASLQVARLHTKKGKLIDWNQGANYPKARLWLLGTWILEVKHASNLTLV